LWNGKIRKVSTRNLRKMIGKNKLLIYCEPMNFKIQNSKFKISRLKIILKYLQFIIIVKIEAISGISIQI
ncbi:MAG: hypothetical protein ACYT04_84225, partial [Nostoc sp.]